MVALHLPRSRPVRLAILVILSLGALHLLDLLPLTSSSSRPPVYQTPPRSSTPRKKDPDLEKHLFKVLEDARNDPSHPNRQKAPSRPPSKETLEDVSSRKLKGNTLVLATSSKEALLGLMSVQKSFEELGSFMLPGVNSGEIKTWVIDADEKKGTLAMEGLVKWIDGVREELEEGGKSAEKRLGDTKGGVGGVVLGSCEADLPLLTTSLLKLHSLLPSTLRFPVVCLLSNPNAFLSFTDPTESDWTSASVLGPWSQSGSISILVASPHSSLPFLSNHFARLSLRPFLAPFGYEHIPFTSYVPSLPLPSDFKRASWRATKKLFGGGKQDVKREGKKPALVDVGVVDDGAGASYEALFKDLEEELDASPSTFGYLDPLTPTSAFFPDTSPKARSQFLLHLVLPPPSVIPWTAVNVKKPSAPVVPARLKEAVRVHWDWESVASEELDFWTAMDQLDLLIPGGEVTSTPSLPLSLSLSLSLSIPYLTHSSATFPFTLPKPNALSSLATVKLLRTGTGEGVEMGTHWNLRREVLAVLERGWKWKEGKWRERYGIEGVVGRLG